MFIFNMKINGNKWSKIFIGLICVTLIVVTFIISINLLDSEYFTTDDIEQRPKDNVYELNTSNYTSVLQNVHENIDQYVGQNIKFSGYIFTLYDFTEEQFVLGRDMIISSRNETLVVGFLCNCSELSNYNENDWVEIEGTIVKGDYNGDIPVIEIYSINSCEIPNDEFVYPPDSTYIATSTVL